MHHPVCFQENSSKFSLVKWLLLFIASKLNIFILEKDIKGVTLT